MDPISHTLFTTHFLGHKCLSPFETRISLCPSHSTSPS